MSKKTCKMEGCTYPLFARGYCKRHYNSEYLAPKQKLKKTEYPLTPSESYQIPKRTEKRAKQERTYTTNRKTFIAKKKEENPKGKIFCIFCGNEIFGEPSLHHAMGRDDESLLDESQWDLAHNKCHVEEYHGKSWKDIWWWQGYLLRIVSNIELYAKEILRMSK